MNVSVTDLVITVGESPMHVLTICDQEYNKIALVAIGDRESLRGQMRRISEVLHVAGDPVEQDMSGAVTGYPTINHGKVSLQIITFQDFLEGETDVKGFVATGAHLA